MEVAAAAAEEDVDGLVEGVTVADLLGGDLGVCVAIRAVSRVGWLR